MWINKYECIVWCECLFHCIYWLSVYLVPCSLIFTCWIIRSLIESLYMELGHWEILTPKFGSWWIQTGKYKILIKGRKGMVLKEKLLTDALYCHCFWIMLHIGIILDMLIHSVSSLPPLLLVLFSFCLLPWFDLCSDRS